MALVIASSISLALFRTIDKIKIYAVFTSEIVIEKLLHTWLTVDCLILAGTPIVAVNMTGTLKSL